MAAFLKKEKQKWLAHRMCHEGAILSPSHQDLVSGVVSCRQFWREFWTSWRGHVKTLSTKIGVEVLKRFESAFKYIGKWTQVVSVCFTY